MLRTRELSRHLFNNVMMSAYREHCFGAYRSMFDPYRERIHGLNALSYIGSSVADKIAERVIGLELRTLNAHTIKFESWTHTYFSGTDQKTGHFLIIDPSYRRLFINHTSFGSEASLSSTALFIEQPVFVGTQNDLQRLIKQLEYKRQIDSFLRANPVNSMIDTANGWYRDVLC